MAPDGTERNQQLRYRIMAHSQERKIMTPHQAADLLAMDEKTITRWARAGYIPAHPIGEGKRRFWRFFEDEVHDWLARQQNAAVVA